MYRPPGAIAIGRIARARAEPSGRELVSDVDSLDHLECVGVDDFEDTLALRAVLRGGISVAVHRSDARVVDETAVGREVALMRRISRRDPGDDSSAGRVNDVHGAGCRG